MDSGQGSFNRRQDADDLTDYVNNGWLSSNEFDGPTFLWNHMIREASREGSDQRNDVPVANLSDADTVINMPMQWYFDALASMVPTAHRYADIFDRFAGAVRRGRGGRQRGDQHAMA